jgi:hypothetical protein
MMTQREKEIKQKSNKPESKHQYVNRRRRRRKRKEQASTI